MSSISSISIRRPVLAVVMSLVIVLFGVIGFFFLGVREYPSVERPIITVMTSYAGANADVIDSQITEPLEASINAVDGIQKLTSVSREGSSRITVEFGLDVDIERAANDVRDRVSAATGRLPADANPPRVSKDNPDNTPLVFLSISSNQRSLLELSEIANIDFAERLQTIDGVSVVDVWGERRMAMRIWLNPQRLAAYGLTPLDIQQALRAQNVELPSGRIEGDLMELTVRTMARLSAEEEFENLILRQEGSNIVRLSDVAQVQLGAQNEQRILKRDGVPMVGVVVRPQPGANHIDIVDEFHERVEAIARDLPADVQVGVGFDNTRYIRASIAEVRQTIFIALLLVILIIFLFLRDWRTTVIPVMVIPVSLIGAFFVMYLAGFSINVLTLLALVLAVGLVVDDAIVVVENIYAKIEAGMDPQRAGEEGTREIFFAVVATTLALVSVFLPILFLSGLTGRLFREFGVVLAGAVIISSFAALTLTPMLAVRMLKRRERQPWLYRATEPFFRSMSGEYEGALGSFLNRRFLALPIVLGAGLGAYALWNHLPAELAPLEDRSQMRVQATAPEGSTFEYMDAWMDRMEEVLVAEAGDEIRALVTMTPGFGAGASNSAFSMVMLHDPRDRVATQQEVADRFNRALRELPGARAVISQPPTISGGGRFGGLQMQYVLLAPNLEALVDVLPDFMARAEQEPALGFVDVNLKFDRPELQVEIDRDRAQTLGISARDISQTMQLALSGLRYDYFVRDGRQYEVIGQVARDNRNEPVDLNALYVRSGSGQPVPLGNLVRFTEHVGPTQLFRFDRYTSATVSGQLAPGYSIQDGIEAMDRVAAEVLDGSFATTLDGEARDYAEGARTLLYVFALALLLVYLVLAAQFESFRDPLIILFTVPLAMTGALVSLWYFDQTLNVFSQIGMIMLVGLVTKHGILIVEFANQRKAAGLAIPDAIRQAAAARFRPILMTAFSTMLGVLPIALALGAGAESRMPMGIAVVGGMLIGTFLTLFIVPAMYTFITSRESTRVPMSQLAKPPGGSSGGSGGGGSAPGPRGPTGSPEAGPDGAAPPPDSSGSPLPDPALAGARMRLDTPMCIAALALIPALAFSTLASPAPLTAQEPPPAVGIDPDEAPLLTLEEALELARAHNPTILQAANRARIGANDHSLGNAGFLPSLNLSAQQSRRTMGSGLGGAGLMEEATLDVVTTLGYTAFDARRQPVFQLLGVEEEELRVAAEQLTESVLADVALVYYDLVRQQQQIETLREAIEISEDRVRIAELRLDLGSASELDVRVAQVDRNADRSALLRQEVELATGLAALNRLLAHELPPVYRVADSIPIDRELDLDRLSEAALIENRAIRLAEKGIAAAELERRVVERERWPTVGLQVGYAVNNLADPLGFTPSRPSGITWGLSAGVNLFDGFDRRRRAENARIRLENSRIGARDARTGVLTGLEAAYATFRSRIGLVELEEENAEVARQNAELALERFSQGLSSSLELREVQNQLTTARSRLAAARLEAKRAEIDLLLLAGRFPG